jgi:hypothetical protein
MAETQTDSDMRTGLGLLFAVLTVIAALTVAATSYSSALDHSDTMQLVSGVALAVALIAGSLVIAAIHIYE